MNRVWLGALLGVTVGVADAALLGAFCARFALGFFATTARLPLPPIWAGIVVGLLTSMPDAIITKTYAPILGTGVLFGVSSLHVPGTSTSTKADARCSPARLAAFGSKSRRRQLPELLSSVIANAR
jgi:hypothetical protein